MLAATNGSGNYAKSVLQ